MFVGALAALRSLLERLGAVLELRLLPMLLLMLLQLVRSALAALAVLKVASSMAVLSFVEQLFRFSGFSNSNCYATRTTKWGKTSKT